MSKGKPKKTIKEGVYYLIRYKTKELMAFAIIVLVLILISLMLHYDEATGWGIRPSAKIEKKL